MSHFRCTRTVALAALVLVAAVTGCGRRRIDASMLQGAPQQIWSPPLEYPESLLRAGIEGSVTLQARVDEHGRVQRSSIRVLRSTNRAFVDPAIDMLMGTRFRPATRDGVPVRARIEMLVTFEAGDTVTDSAAAAAAVVQGEQMARAGDIAAAMEMFAEARRLDARLASSNTIWWSLCWYGTIWGHAPIVLDVCDRLVALEPQSARVRDARGIARALTGDLRGAVADFEAVVDADDSPIQRTERSAWLGALRAGYNPVTRQVLERLRAAEP